MSGPAIPPRYGARQAMPLQGFLDQTEGVDLDAILGKLEGTPAVSNELALERERVAKLAAAWAATPEGAAILEFLADVSVRRPVFLPGLGAEAVAYVAHREGQNNLFWQLVQLIAIGRDETPPAREGM
ncbi:hypothetical protein M2322_003030 [Rhodoblastus acidophilus]|uniref:hypothetical protein n=1 Tax=Rhodoblastus acidophilus TaxID=1074 RepID=UPI002225460A|nr:hypothetical protein [Rhodoblastus acidophilus]MCW2317471.1 hypothetical protein [Rhodoblastus acidophilus]